jgi:hypothetical protein
MYRGLTRKGEEGRAMVTLSESHRARREVTVLPNTTILFMVEGVPSGGMILKSSNKVRPGATRDYA